MKTTLIITLASTLLTLADAASPQKKCSDNSCLRAVTSIGSSDKNNAADCKSFLLTTVTPNTSTKVVTKTVTSTPTKLKSVTKTVTVSKTGTTTVSTGVVATKSFTTTAYAAVTTTKTDFKTTTVPNSKLPSGIAKRDKVSQPSKIPKYASACSNVSSYKSACSCIGVSGQTTTAPTPKVTKTVTKTVTPFVKVVTTTVATQSLTKTVSVKTAQKTYTTKVVSKPVATITKASTTKTKTVTSFATITAPPTDKLYIALDDGFNYLTQGGPGLPGSGNPEVFGYGHPADAVPLKYLSNSRHFAVQEGPSAGELMYGAPKAQGGRMVYIASPEGAAEVQAGLLDCTVVKVGKLRVPRCMYSDADERPGDWWLCANVLHLVESGFDFSTSCQFSYKIGLEVRLPSEVVNGPS